VEHELSLKKGAVRRVEGEAISPDGEADPISVEEDEG